jgi:hypothetical protein
LDQKLAQLLAQPRIGLSALKEYNEILARFGLPSSNLPWSIQSDMKILQIIDTVNAPTAGAEAFLMDHKEKVL